MFRIYDIGIMVQGSGLTVQLQGFRVQGSGFRVEATRAASNGRSADKAAIPASRTKSAATAAAGEAAVSPDGSGARSETTTRALGVTAHSTGATVRGLNMFGWSWSILALLLLLERQMLLLERQMLLLERQMLLLERQMLDVESNETVSRLISTVLGQEVMSCSNPRP